MADKNSKSSNNVNGKYYVDNSCIGCGQCVDTACDFFAQADDGMAYVKKQPLNNDDIILCEQACSNCPVEAIGNNGCCCR